MLRWLAIFVVALTIMTPALVWGPGATDSGIYNFIWTRQFGEAMASGQFYPRWLPDSFEGLGSPTFYFYPPFAFWVSGALDALGFPTLQAINGAAALLLLGSGASMYA